MARCKRATLSLSNRPGTTTIVESRLDDFLRFRRVYASPKTAHCCANLTKLTKMPICPLKCSATQNYVEIAQCRDWLKTGSNPVGHPAPSPELTAQAGSVRPTRQAIREPFLNTTNDAMRVVINFIGDLAQGSLRELDIPPIPPDSGNHFMSSAWKSHSNSVCFRPPLGWRNSVSRRFVSDLCL